MKKAAAPVLEQPVNFRKYYYILGIIVFFIFANTMSNGYNLDDELVTRGHKLTSRGLEAVKDIFTSPYYSDNMGYAYGYRPVVHLSFALEHDIFGEKPAVSHFINVLLYVLSVVLFFRLLLKWAGEKQIVFALISVGLFAVHPVHTEVVASIKNRDEILAFLFVICAALSMEKYLVKGKIFSLLWIFLFFSLAMLSKKSVFPLAILLPAAAIFLRPVAVTRIVLISFVLLVPAALIGSELEVFRMTVIFGFGAVLIALTAFLKLQGAKEEPFWPKLLDYRLVLPVSAVLLGYGIYVNNAVLYFPAAALPALFYKRNPRFAEIAFIAEGLAAFWFFQDYDLGNLLVMGVSVLSYLAFAGLQEKKYNWTVMAGTVAFAAMFASAEPARFYIIPAVLIFSFLIHKKWLIGVAYAIIVFVLYAVLVKVSFFALLILVISAIRAAEVYRARSDMSSLVMFFGVISLGAFMFPGFGRYKPEPAAVVVAASQVSDPKDKGFMKEGRNLEFVENTLVEPHTPAETFGTGAATLGEYARLMLFPYELSFYYGYARTRTVDMGNPWVWISVVFYLGLVVLAVWQLNKRFFISLGIAWYLGCVLLFSNWFELVAGMVGERLAFTASAGFCILIAAVFLWIKPDFSFMKPGAAEFTIIAIAIFFAGRTITRNTDWKNTLTLMGHDIKHLENSSQANNLYALNLMRSSVEDVEQTREQQLEKQQAAVVHFDKALKIWPSFFNAAYDKGRAGMALQDTAVAIAGFEQAVAIGNDNFTDVYYQLGDLYLQSGRKKDFLEITKKIYSISQNTPDGYSVLARGYFVNGYADSAKTVLEQSIARFPQNTDLKKNLEMVKSSIKTSGK